MYLKICGNLRFIGKRMQGAKSLGQCSLIITANRWTLSCNRGMPSTIPCPRMKHVSTKLVLCPAALVAVDIGYFTTWFCLNQIQ